VIIPSSTGKNHDRFFAVHDLNDERAIGGEIQYLSRYEAGSFFQSHRPAQNGRAAEAQFTCLRTIAS